MKKKLFFIIVISIIISFLSPNLIAYDLSYDKEIEIGRKFHLQLASKKVLFYDPIVDKYFQGICQKILKAAGPQPFDYHFNLVNNSVINAFAVPGGYIYLNTETIISLENEGQLASIIAHEIAHVTSRHFAQRLESSKGLSAFYIATLLAGLLISSRGGGGAAIGQAIIFGGGGATAQMMLANSRADESEADIKGRKYLIKAGYNPADMYGAFAVLNEKTYHLSSGIPTYLSTHPDLSYRLATTFKDLLNQPKSPATKEYKMIQDRVLALTGEPRRIRSLISKRDNPNDASSLHMLSLLAIREQNLTLADKYLRQALELEPTNKEFLADMGDLTLKRKKAKEAINYYEKAKNGSTHDQAILGLSRSYELLGDIKKATVYYEELITINPLPPTALEYAGRFFGKTGQVAKGHYFLGAYFLESGNIEHAIFHYKEVEKSPNNYSYIKLAEQKIKDLEELKNSKKN